MKKNFNPKVYLNKNRIYQSITGYRGISKLWIWNDELRTYEPPQRGHPYYARKSVLHLGTTKRLTESFGSLDEAREWMKLCPLQPSPVVQKAQLSFKDVVEDFKSARFPKLALGTRDYYSRQLRLHFSEMSSLDVREMKSTDIDTWLETLLQKNKRGNCKSTRDSFKKELTLLQTILSFCSDHYDDLDKKGLIKSRHWDKVSLKKTKQKQREITENEFLCFLDKLKLEKNGELFSSLATVQFYQALRISEACAMKWENIQLNHLHPQDSTLIIDESVYWPRRRNAKTFIQSGFKNSKKLGGRKISNLLPESFATLAKMHSQNASGLVFALDGQILEYRWVQYAYDRALKKAGLPYTGSHIMRHGGASLAYNMSNGNLAAAAAHLGNTVSAAQTYSHLNKETQKKFVDSIWEKSLAANGCISEENIARKNLKVS